MTTDNEKVCKSVLDPERELRLSPLPMTGKTLNLAGVARYLGVSRRNLYDQIKDGRFSVTPIAGSNPRRWSVEAIDKWLAGANHAN